MHKITVLFALLLLIPGCASIIGPEPYPANDRQAAVNADIAPAEKPVMPEPSVQPVKTTADTPAVDMTTDASTTMKKPLAVSEQLWVRISFKSGHSSVEPRVRKALSNIAGKFLAESTTQTLAIRGYSDNEPVGGYKGNHKSKHSYHSLTELSLSRAKAVADILAKAGISRDVMHVEGLGASNFIADNKTRAGRYKNRRVDVFLVGN